MDDVLEPARGDLVRGFFLERTRSDDGARDRNCPLFEDRARPDEVDVAFFGNEAARGENAERAPLLRRLRGRSEHLGVDPEIAHVDLGRVETRVHLEHGPLAELGNGPHETGVPALPRERGIPDDEVIGMRREAVSDAGQPRDHVSESRGSRAVGAVKVSKPAAAHHPCEVASEGQQP